MSPGSKPKTKRVRADLLLVERGLCPTRAKAQAFIMAGAVRSGETTIDKPGTLVAVDAPLEIAGQDGGERESYVSRGGVKLAGALSSFAEHGLSPAGAVVVDIGASTGGFTDCLLRRGASKVYAVDVGYGQLAYVLRNDPRVVVRERTNARHLTFADFAEPIDLVVVDASFIGLGKLMPAIASIVREDGGALVALIKPQFEAGPKAAAAGRGVIRDEKVREEAIETARGSVRDAGFGVIAEADSVLPGPRGNVERFVYARRIRSA
jgi:23S rRNA (cytidine1920-2'-O)/16S rRNA (cytidine1409-2'-O)-methyltransferase